MADAVARPAATEETAVRAALQLYLDGIREGDVERLRQAFHPLAVMSGYLGEDPMVVHIQRLYDLVDENPSPAESGAPFSAEVESVEVVGGTATAVIREYGYLGHDFRDEFHLLELDGSWRIVSKLFTTV